MAIITVIALGLIKSETDNLSQSYQNLLHTTAIIQSQNLLEQLQLTRSVSLDEWNNENKTLLPGGHGNYECNTIQCTVNIQWHIKKNYALQLNGE